MYQNFDGLLIDGESDVLPSTQQILAESESGARGQDALALRPTGLLTRDSLLSESLIAREILLSNRRQELLLSSLAACCQPPSHDRYSSLPTAPLYTSHVTSGLLTGAIGRSSLLPNTLTAPHASSIIGSRVNDGIHHGLLSPVAQSTRGRVQALIQNDTITKLLARQDLLRLLSESGVTDKARA